MINIRKSLERGHVNHGWLNSYFTFSFADYHDPEHMGFRVLRVINEDRIAPSKGFGPHAHRDMEIITYILEGTLAHRDSMGEHHEIGPNEIQIMSAGSGIIHSEVNPSSTETVHLLQIWIEAAAEDVQPFYQQVAIAAEEKEGRLRLLTGPANSNANADTVIHQDVRLYAVQLAKGESVTATLGSGRYGWVQVVRGNLSLNGHPIEQGDGAAISNEAELLLSGLGNEASEVLFFDLP